MILEDRDFQAGSSKFFVTTVSRPAIEGIQPPTQWVKMACSLRVRRVLPSNFHYSFMSDIRGMCESLNNIQGKMNLI
jgi:hypothetical protein